MPGPDALSHRPVIDELRQKAYGTQWEREKEENGQISFFECISLLQGRALACLYVPLQPGQFKLRTALE